MTAAHTQTTVLEHAQRACEPFWARRAARAVATLAGPCSGCPNSYAIIAAVTSEEGARVGVCVAYAVAVVVLGFLAMKMWTYPGRGTPQSA